MSNNFSWELPLSYPEDTHTKCEHSHILLTNRHDLYLLYPSYCQIGDPCSHSQLHKQYQLIFKKYKQT